MLSELEHEKCFKTLGLGQLIEDDEQVGYLSVSLDMAFIQRKAQSL